MRAGHGDDGGLVFALVSLPREGVGLLRAPFARGLAAFDAEVQMRPATARAFFAEEADALTHLHACAHLNGRINRMQMAVAVIPAAFIEQIHDVVARTHGRE